MKNKKPNAELVWKQLEDQLAPRLRLSVIERTVYAHLLRHTRLEGKPRFRFSILRLARNIRVSTGPVRDAVRRLAAYGALRLVQRSKAGHVVAVRLPDEIPALSRKRIESQPAAKEQPARVITPRNIEEADFLHSKPLRKSIHARERSQCFYCLRRTTPTVQCLDHVVERAPAPTLTATSSLLAWNATYRKEKNPPAIFSAASTANAASPPSNSPAASAPSTPWPPASSVPASIGFSY